jgi:transcriptional regulator with XRE-family HTH domain
METAEQLRAARAMVSWSQEQLAQASQVSKATIKRLESATGKLPGNPSTIAALRGALEKRGVVFVTENGGPPGVRFKGYKP